MRTPISRDELNRNGWTCPDCGWDIARAGSPNEPEVIVCYNPRCPSPLRRIEETP